VCVKVIEAAHERTIYSISWGPKPGATGERELGWLASAGGDGRICVWELEVSFASDAKNAFVLIYLQDEDEETPPKHRNIATVEGAHGVSDVNNVVWCPREGRGDLLASVGDDCEARVWNISPS